MKKIINLDNYKIILIYIILLFIFFLMFIILNIDINKKIPAIINVDEEKEMIILIDKNFYYDLRNVKNINFIFENKNYLLENFSMNFNNITNTYEINFNNLELENLLKPNSTISISLNHGSIKIYEIIFNTN